jgi:hypothetical protein
MSDGAQGLSPLAVTGLWSDRWALLRRDCQWLTPGEADGTRSAMLVEPFRGCRARPSSRPVGKVGSAYPTTTPLLGNVASYQVQVELLQ